MRQRRILPPEPPEAKSWPLYRLFGSSLASDFPFANRLLPGESPPNLLFYSTKAPVDSSWRGLTPVYTSRFQDDQGQPIVVLYQAGEDYLLRFTRIVDFAIGAGRIACHLLDPAYAYLVEIYFLGTAMTLFLEATGRLSLHGSCVCLDDEAGAVGFLAGNKGGKSCVAASFLREGHALLSDDILALSPGEEGTLVFPGYPQMRLEPPEVEHFCGAGRSFELVHPGYRKQRVPVGTPGSLGRFCGEPKPLKTLYLLERQEPHAGDAPIAITPLAGAEGMIELMRHGFEPVIAEALGFQSRRLQALAALCRHTSVRRLSFASGFARLPDVCRAIVQDVRRQAD